MYLFAFVVCDSTQKISEQEIINVCKQNLEAYKVPEYVSVIDSMPKTPNGKFNIIKLKDMALQQVTTEPKSILI